MKTRLVDWLAGRSKKAHRVGYYFTADQRRVSKEWVDHWRPYQPATGNYYAFQSDHTAVKAWLDSLPQNQNPSTVIAEINPKTKQNAFHHVLSTNSFRVDDGDQSGNYITSDSFFILHGDIPNNNVTEYHHYWAGNWNTEGDVPNVKTNKWIEIHNGLLGRRKLKSRAEQQNAETTNENEALVLAELLSRFDNDNELETALLLRDENGNTPLFCAYKYKNNTASFAPLLDRIKTMSEDRKRRLFFQHNENGKTVIHQFFSGSQWKNVEIHDHSVFKQALCQQDLEGNTPLHDVFLNNNRLSMIKSLCAELKSEQKPEQTQTANGEEPPPYEAKSSTEKNIDKAFCQNLTRYNPLHLACQQPSNRQKNNVMIFTLLLSLLSESARFAKLKEKDGNGCTPLHHAIRTGNYDIVKAALEKLNPEQKKEIAMIGNKQYQTLLHYACRYGNYDIVRLIFDTLGPQEVVNTRCRQPSLDLRVLASNNKNISLSNFDDILCSSNDVLFNLFYYFVQTCGDGKSQNFLDRINDFDQCLREREQKDPPTFSVGNSKFRATDYGLFKGSERYYQMRVNLQKVTEQHVATFRTFLKTQTSDKARLVAKHLDPTKNLAEMISPPGLFEQMRRKASSLFLGSSARSPSPTATQTEGSSALSQRRN